MGFRGLKTGSAMNKIRDLMLRPWSCQDGAESSLLQGKNTYTPGSTNIEIENSKVVSTHLWNTPLNLSQQAVKGILS